MYVEGYPEWLLAQTFGLVPEALHRHAWGKNWHRRRAFNLPDRKELWTMAVMVRLRQSWHLFAPDTADKMLKLLGESIGIGQQVKVEAQGKLTWEQLLAEARREEGQPAGSG